MVDIITHIHTYVPVKKYSEDYTIQESGETVSVPKSRVFPVLFGGEQLTAARARGAKRVKVNSAEASSHLDGIIPVAKDWHAQLNLLEVRMV